MKCFKFWIGIVSGAVFFYFAVSHTEFEKIWDAIRNALFLPLCISIILRITTLWLRAVRWLLILKPLKQISLSKLFNAVSIGEMANHLLPARGGEIIRVFMVSTTEHISKTHLFTSVFVEKLYDLAVVLIILLCASFFISLPEPISRALHTIVTAFFFIISILIILIIILKTMINSYALNYWILKFKSGLCMIQNHKYMSKIFVESMLIWGMTSLSLYFIILSLSIQVSWYVAFIMIAVNAAGSAIPSPPAGLGTTEFIFVMTLEMFSVDKSTALACAFVAHGLQFFVVVFVGLTCLILRKSPTLRSSASALPIPLHLTYDT